MSLTAYERETVINLNDLDDFAIVVTYQRTMITKLRRNEAAELLEYWETDGSPGARFRIPANLVSIRNPRQPVSEETRVKLAANVARARSVMQQPLVTRMDPI